MSLATLFVSLSCKKTIWFVPISYNFHVNKEGKKKLTFVPSLKYSSCFGSLVGWKLFTLKRLNWGIIGSMNGVTTITIIVSRSIIKLRKLQMELEYARVVDQMISVIILHTYMRILVAEQC